MRRRLIVTTTALVAVAIIALSVPLAIAVRGQLTTQAFDTTQGVAEQASLLLDATARSCSELQLRVAQLQDAPATLSATTFDPALVATTAEAATVVRIATQPLQDASTGLVGRAVTGGRIVVTVPLSTNVCGQPLALQADQPADVLATRIRRAWLTIAAGALLVAGAAAGFAAWYGRRIARPFEALARSARSLGDGDFSARAPRSGIAEADAIAEALDDTAARLGRTVERASAFTADASHQLRTPLTALQLQLDTAEGLIAAGRVGDGVVPVEEPVEGPFADGSSADRALRAALSAAHEEAERLGATIDDLVALTRLDAPETEIDLARFVAARTAGWRSQAAELRRAVEVSVPAEVGEVRVRPAALAQILQILVDNALQHGTGTIRIVGRSLSATTGAAGDTEHSSPGVLSICVLDEGPAPPVGGAGEQPFHRPGGRGLPLARALAAAEGGRLDLFSEADETRACLVLPAGGAGVGSR